MQQQSTPSVKSLLRFKQLQQVVPLSRSEIDRLVSLGQFPAPIKLGLVQFRAFSDS
jgi:predicted DNA-binding transcriptional regulator AlpA